MIVTLNFLKKKITEVSLMDACELCSKPSSEWPLLVQLVSNTQDETLIVF